MRIDRKILSFCLALLLVVTLSSCNSVNKTTPYGDISSDSVYATAQNGSISVSDKEVYDYIKSYGYSIVLENMFTSIFADEIDAMFDSNGDFVDPDEKELLDGYIISEIYGTTDAETYEKLTSTAKQTSIQQYIDYNYQIGIYLTTSQLSVSVVYDEDKGIDVIEADNNFPYELYEPYLYERVLFALAKEELMVDCLEEKLDGLKNSNYISETDVKTAYYSVERKYTTTDDDGQSNIQAIAIKFNNRQQANNALELVGDLDGKSNEEVLQAYFDMYNDRYPTNTNLTMDNYLTDSEVNFVVSEYVNELTDYSSKFETMIRDTLEDGDYFTAPVNVDGYYYLIYKIQAPTLPEWDELDDYQDFIDSYDDVYERLVETKVVSSYYTQIETDIVEEIIKAGDFYMYDPLFDEYFDQDYDTSDDDDFEYDKTSKFDNDLIYKFTYEGVEYTYSVNDLYAELDAIYGVSAASTLLTNKFLVSLDMVSDIEDEYEDTLEDYEDELDDLIDDFKSNDNTSFDKSMGVENFLIANFGYATEDDVYNYYYKATFISKVLMTYYGEHTSDNINFESDEFFDMLEVTASNLTDAQIDLYASHLLIAIDTDGSGNYEDPTYFKSQLTDEELVEFNQAVVDLANAIMDELEYLIEQDSFEDREISTYLTAICDSFTKGANLYSDTSKSWNDYKTFNLTIKFETLGSISYTSSKNYVEEFADKIDELYSYFIELDDDVEDYFDEDGIYEYGYIEFIYEEDNTITSTDDLCETAFGYHIINVEDVTLPESCMYEESDDIGDDYFNLEVTVELDGEDDDDDPDRTLIASAYSSTDSPSSEQLFIYFYETLNGKSYLPSFVSSNIDLIFSEAYTKVTGDTFFTYRLLILLGEIDFTDEAKTENYEQLMIISIRNIEAYTGFAEDEDGVIDFNALAEYNVYYEWYNFDDVFSSTWLVLDLIS